MAAMQISRMERQVGEDQSINDLFCVLLVCSLLPSSYLYLVVIRYIYYFVHQFSRQPITFYILWLIINTGSCQSYAKQEAFQAAAQVVMEQCVIEMDNEIREKLHKRTRDEKKNKDREKCICPNMSKLNVERKRALTDREDRISEGCVIGQRDRGREIGVPMLPLLH